MKALSSEFDAFLDQVIQEHREHESGDQVSNRKDFVSIIMQLQKDRMYDLDLTQDNIKGVLLIRMHAMGYGFRLLTMFSLAVNFLRDSLAVTVASWGRLCKIIYKVV
ncbi:hypothetical protein V6N13_061928 [Hibiscus sabdariffa]